MSSRSMRAIWDAVHVALMGAPSALLSGEQAEPTPQEEQHHSVIDPSHLASHFQTLLEEQLSWIHAPPDAQLLAALAIEASEVAPEEVPELAEAPQQLELSASEEGVAQELPADAPLPVAQPSAELAAEASEELALESPEEEAVSPQRPPVLFSEEGEGGFQDFFLFIKDYGWSLRYRVHQLTDSILDQEKPLQLEWVKLRRPVRNPDELLSTSGEDLFDWDVKEPASHQGFMYHVTRAVGSGVEAVINFFEGYGMKLLIQPDSGIQLTGGPESKRKGQGVDDEPRSVTHCWVQVMGMPFLPILQSIAFFNLEEVVMDWSA